jgi:hypothetical protein
LKAMVGTWMSVLLRPQMRLLHKFNMRAEAYP